MKISINEKHNILWVIFLNIITFILLACTVGVYTNRSHEINHDRLISVFPRARGPRKNVKNPLVARGNILYRGSVDWQPSRRSRLLNAEDFSHGFLFHGNFASRSQLKISRVKKKNFFDSLGLMIQSLKPKFVRKDRGWKIIRMKNPNPTIIMMEENELVRGI